ncbi:unnamed protein product [Closterium sp. NIES-54]
MANRSYHRRSGTDLHGMEDFHGAELSHSNRRDVSPSPAFPPYHDTGRSPRNSPLSRGHAEQAPPPSQKKHHRSLSQPFFDPLPVENIAERINALGIPNLQSSPLRATENDYRGKSGGRKGSTRASSKGSHVDECDNVGFDDDDSSDSSGFSGKGISYYRDRVRPGSSGGSRPGSAISSGSGAGSAAGSVTAMSGSSVYGAVSLSREFVFDMRQHPSSPPRHVSARWSGASQPAHAQPPPKELLRSDDEDEDGIEDPEDAEQPPPARRAHTASDAMRGKKGARAISGASGSGKDAGLALKGNGPLSPSGGLGAVSRFHTTSNAERRHRAEGGGTGGRRTSLEGGSMSNLSGSGGFSSSTGSLRASVDAPQKSSSRRLSASASFNPRSSHAATTFNHSGPHAAAHSGPQAALSPRAGGPSGGGGSNLGSGPQSRSGKSRTTASMAEADGLGLGLDKLDALRREQQQQLQLAAAAAAGHGGAAAARQILGLKESERRRGPGSGSLVARDDVGGNHHHYHHAQQQQQQAHHRHQELHASSSGGSGSGGGGGAGSAGGGSGQFRRGTSADNRSPRHARFASEVPQGGMHGSGVHSSEDADDAAAAAAAGGGTAGRAANRAKLRFSKSLKKVAGEAGGDAEDTPVADSLLRRPPALEIGKLSAGAAASASFSGPVVVGSGDAGQEGAQAAGEAAGGERGRAAGGGPVLDQSKSGRRAFLGLLKGLRSPRLSGTFDLATGAGLKSPTGGDDWAAGATAGAAAMGVSPRGGGGGAGGGGGGGGRSGSPAEAAAGERKSASRPSLSPLRSPRLFSFSGSKRFDKSPRGIAHSLTGTGSMRSPRGGGDGGGSPENWTVGTGGKEGILKRGYADVRKRYEVGDKIGEGRPGVVVYACTARRSGRALACKSIDKKTLDDDKKAEALRLEVELMKQLGVHGGIVSVRDAIEDDTRVHLLMELCSGGDLLNFVNTAPAISEQQAATIVRRLADAVRYCHRQGVVHRDLKPENILMAAKGAWWDLRVADFGISAMLKPGERIRGYAGSPFYIAPEVLGGAYAFECDVWSLGVVLYVLLAQKLPFWHDSDAGVYKLILKGHVDTRTGPWTSISRDAKGLVHRMLTSDASQRITLDEVIEHPWVVANQCEVPEAPPPPSEAETKQAKRRRAIARSRANIIASFRLPFCLTPLTNDSVYSDSEGVV